MSVVDRSAFAYNPAALPVHHLPFPEGGEGAIICMREMSACDQRELLAAHGAQAGGTSFVYDLLARTLCHPTGVLLFDGREDLERSFGLGTKCLRRLAEQALEINDMRGEEKNSPPPSATITPSVGSSASSTQTTSSAG